MNLFSKDKELILKITNAILVIWFLGAMAFLSSGLIDLLIKEVQMTYDEYRVNNCTYMEEKASCEDMYNMYLSSSKSNDFYNKRTVYTALANVAIVLGTTFVLNKNKKNTKK